MAEAEHPSELLMLVVSLDHPEASALEKRLTAEMAVRYGGAGPLPVSIEQFQPPQGCFVVAMLDGTAVACGGFRYLRPHVAEIKRLYVDGAARGQGVARRLLAFLEELAAAASYTQTWLETGTEQPEAMALFAAAGYRSMPPYGEFKDDDRSRCFYRTLGPEPQSLDGPAGTTEPAGAEPLRPLRG
jgi:GNAT superfamily N-acetyltransferase